MASQSASKPSNTASNISIRLYSPEDNRDLKSFVESASDTKIFYGMLQFGTKTGDNYFSKLQKFPKAYILLAEEQGSTPNDKRICGSIELGIREAQIEGDKEHIAYISNLQVDKRLKKRGIEERLLKEIESLASNDSVSVIISKVHASGEEERKLFENMGYNELASKMLVIYNVKRDGDVVFSKNLPDAGNVTFQQIEAEKVKEYFKQDHTPSDYSVISYEEILSSSSYCGTYTAQSEDGRNIAGVSLFAQNPDNIYGLKRFIVDSAHYSKSYFHLISLGVLSILPVTIFYTMNNKLQSKPAISAVVALGINIGLIFGYMKVLQYARLLSVNEKKGSYVGLFYRGEEKHARELMGYLFENMNRIAHSKGFGNVSVSANMTDRYFKYYPIGGWRVQNLLFGKRLKGRKENVEMKIKVSDLLLSMME